MICPEPLGTALIQIAPPNGQSAIHGKTTTCGGYLSQSATQKVVSLVGARQLRSYRPMDHVRLFAPSYQQ